MPKVKDWKQRLIRAVFLCIPCYVAFLALIILGCIAFTGQRRLAFYDFPVVNATPDLYLVEENLNYTDASKYCVSNYGVSLWYPKSEMEEVETVQWARKYIDFRKCPRVLLGHRMILDRGWSNYDHSKTVSSMSSIWGIGVPVTDITNTQVCTVLEKSNSSLPYELKQASCQLNTSCHLCFKGAPNCMMKHCFIVKILREFISNLVDVCENDYSSVPAVVTNERELKAVVQILNSRTDIKQCSQISLGLRHFPIYETITEETINYLPGNVIGLIGGSNQLWCLALTKTNWVKASCHIPRCFLCG